MRIIHRIARKAPLKQEAAPAFAEIDPAAITAVRLTQRRAQTIGALRRQDQVDVIVHQTPGKADSPLRRARFRQQREVSGAVLIAEKHWQPPIAPLRDMVRDLGNDDAGESGHDGGDSGRSGGGLISIVSPELE